MVCVTEREFFLNGVRYGKGAEKTIAYNSTQNFCILLPLHTLSTKMLCHLSSISYTGRDLVVDTTTFYHCVLVTH